MTLRFISIVMPALNEAPHIERAIASLLPTSADIEYEVLVLDGGSDDGTQDIVARLAQENPRIRLVPNPRKTQAAALNLAARIADMRANVLLRADCHAEYPPGFASICALALKDKASASVVVPMLTRGKTCMQKAIAAAQNSRLGNGGSKHRRGWTSGYVEHGHHAAFDRQVFQDLGGYCEDMPANEDAEFDRRLTAAGHRIWLCGAATITYFPRKTLTALARQYFAYGFGRASTCLRHGTTPRLRQIFPVIVLLGCVASVLLGALDPRLLAPALGYLVLCLGWGLVLALRTKSACAILAGLAAITMHLSWGAGFLVRLFQGRNLKAQRPSGSSGISRIT